MHNRSVLKCVLGILGCLIPAACAVNRYYDTGGYERPVRNRVRKKDARLLPRRRGYFLAVGSTRYGDGIAYISYNGKNWIRQDHRLLKKRKLVSIVDGKKIFIGCSDGSILEAPVWKLSKRGGYNLSGIAYGNRRFVAVGRQGIGYTGGALVMWSDDGRIWHPVRLGGRKSLSAVTYGNGRFVAVGGWGRCLYSRDGKNWSEGPQIDRNNFSTVFFHKGRFYACGSRNAQFVSRNGKYWEESSGGGEGFSSFTSMAAGRGLFLGTGLYKPVSSFRHSRRGFLFQKTEASAPKLKAVAFGNGIFVGGASAGRLAWSEDGRTWHIQRKGLASIGTFAFGNGVFAAGGAGGAILASRDGKRWKVAVPPGAEKIHCITYGGGKFVAVGASGRHLWSRDGFHWKDDVAESFGVYGLSSGNNRTIAVGVFGRRAWKKGSGPWRSLAGRSTSWLGSVAFGNGRFVAVGQSPFGVHGRRAWTKDGRTWFDDTVAGRGYNEIVFGGGRFVAVGVYGRRTWTLDGKSWKNDRYGSGYWDCVTYGNGRYVAVTKKGRVYVSRNGIKWRSRATQVRSQFFHIAYGRGKFVIAGDRRMLAISRDGVKWRIMKLPKVSDRWGRPVVFDFSAIGFIKRR